jgi:hypothetical protein
MPKKVSKHSSDRATKTRDSSPTTTTTAPAFVEVRVETVPTVEEVPGAAKEEADAQVDDSVVTDTTIHSNVDVRVVHDEEMESPLDMSTSSAASNTSHGQLSGLSVGERNESLIKTKDSVKKNIRTRAFSKKNMKKRLGEAPSFSLDSDKEEDFLTALNDHDHATREENQTFGYSTGGSTSIGLDAQEDISVTDGLPAVRETNSSGSAMCTTNGQDQDESGGTEDMHAVDANGLEPNEVPVNNGEYSIENVYIKGNME